MDAIRAESGRRDGGVGAGGTATAMAARAGRKIFAYRNRSPRLPQILNIVWVPNPS